MTLNMCHMMRCAVKKCLLSLKSWPWHWLLTLNFCSVSAVTWVNSGPHFCKIEQFARRIYCTFTMSNFRAVCHLGFNQLFFGGKVGRGTGGDTQRWVLKVRWIERNRIWGCIMAAIGARNEHFNFRIMLLFLKPASIKGDIGRKWRPNFSLWRPVKFSGRMDETSESISPSSA